MIIKEGTVLGLNTIVINKARGTIYGRVKSYNTKTKKAKLYVTLFESPIPTKMLKKSTKELFERYRFKTPVKTYVTVCAEKKGKPILIEAELPDSVAIDKRTMKEIK